MSSLRALAVLACLLLPACASRPSLIDADTTTGFALYRSGQLDREALRALCDAGVEEMLVLDGGAAPRECSYRPVDCPGLRVRYDRRQDARVPLGIDFLAAFDGWIEEARREGRKIAFRCRHGWHRAGRLSAYYRMRFQGVSPAEAIDEMNRRGRFMWRHRQLEPQVWALGDLVAARPCSVEERHCPAAKGRTPAGLTPRQAFPPDVCP